MAASAADDGWPRVVEVGVARVDRAPRVEHERAEVDVAPRRLERSSDGERGRQTAIAPHR
jgi:hypothetical protein